MSFNAYDQCDVLNDLKPDGSIYYFMQPQVFYFTKSKALKGGIVTDKENYFISMQPSPFPEKPQGRKLKEDLELKLANGRIYTLKHFDSDYIQNDTVLQLLYLIDKRDLKDFIDFETLEVKIDMKGTEGIRTYTFKLHKKAIQEQLDCFVNEEKKKKEK
jgi:hypothetical protein